MCHKIPEDTRAAIKTKLLVASCFLLFIIHYDIHVLLDQGDDGSASLTATGSTLLQRLISWAYNIYKARDIKTKTWGQLFDNSG